MREPDEITVSCTNGSEVTVKPDGSVVVATSGGAGVVLSTEVVGAIVGACVIMENRKRGAPDGG